MKADFSKALPQQRHGLHWDSEEAWEHHWRHHLFTCQDTEDQNVYCHMCSLPLNFCQQLSKVSWVLITGKQKNIKHNSVSGWRLSYQETISFPCTQILWVTLEICQYSWITAGWQNQEHPSFVDWRPRNTLSFLLSGHVNKTDNEPGISNSLSIVRFNIKLLAGEKNENTCSLELLGAPRIPIKALTWKSF
jgi:hypothetical protein